MKTRKNKTIYLALGVLVSVAELGAAGHLEDGIQTGQNLRSQLAGLLGRLAGQAHNTANALCGGN